MLVVLARRNEIEDLRKSLSLLKTTQGMLAHALLVVLEELEKLQKEKKND